MSLKNESINPAEITKKPDKDSSQVTQESIISKLETINNSYKEQISSVSESIDFPPNSSTLFSSNLKEDNSKSKTNTTSNIKLTKQFILNSFKSRKTTLILQKSLNDASKEEIDNIVNELCGSYRQSIKDKNGNYFCSDLFKICNQSQRIKVLKELSNTISEDCTHQFGSHPIQTLIEFSSCEEEYNLLLYSFNNNYKLLFVSIDPLGAHVMTKIFEHIPEKFRTNLNLSYVLIILFISTKRFGVVNAKSFVSCTKNDLIIRKLMNLVKDNFVNIVSTYYGKYLIEKILEKWWNTDEGEEIKELIRENIKDLSNNSNFSYIIGIYLKLANREEKNQLNQILKINSNNNNMMNIDNSNFRKMEALGQLDNNSDLNNINFHNNNNQNVLSMNNLNNNNNIFNNRNEIPLSLNNFGNNNMINNNQIPLQFNNFCNINNFINNNQIPFTLNNHGNNNMMNNLAFNNFNKNNNYYKNNNKWK